MCCDCAHNGSTVDAEAKVGREPWRVYRFEVGEIPGLRRDKVPDGHEELCEFCWQRYTKLPRHERAPCKIKSMKFMSAPMPVTSTRWRASDPDRDGRSER